MKVIIMAAGVGKRLMPLTKDMHKCMIEINGKPIIMRQIETIRSCGISDITVVGGYRIDDLKGYLGSSVSFLFNPFYETTNSVVSLWLAGSIFDDDVIIINSDIIFDKALLQALIDDRSGISIAVSKIWTPEKGYKASIKNGRVVDMGMDLAPDDIGGEYAGMIKFSRAGLQKFKTVLDDFMKEKIFDVWLETALAKMLRAGVPAGYIMVDDKLWLEIDTKEELMAARKKLERDKNVNV